MNRNNEIAKHFNSAALHHNQVQAVTKTMREIFYPF